MSIKICPSILAADFSKLGEEAKRCEQAGADRLHVDVMDGHFVPNLTMGPSIVAALNRSTELYLDVHLMIYNPYDWIERFVEAGADRITVHFEATEDVSDTLEFIRTCGAEVGLAYCPDTSETMIPKYLPMIDTVLCMTVNPGFGGQAFMPEILEKIAFCRQMSERLAKRQKNEGEPIKVPTIQVDGGINGETALQCAEAGASELVAGTFLFQMDNMAEGIESLRKGAEQVYGSAEIT